MSTCFLFAEHINENGCLSLVLKQEEIIAPLQQRNFIEIKILQENNTRTLIIAPSNCFSFHWVELPSLSTRKARAAIPFALEDKLAQSLDSLHFSFEQAHYQNGHYLVAVADKNFLQNLIKQLTTQGIKFANLTADWFALEPQEIAVMPNYLLINNEIFTGALSQDLAPLFLQKLTETSAVCYQFPDSPCALIPNCREMKDQLESSYLWLGKRLQHCKAGNFFHGELVKHGSQENNSRWYKIALTMSLMWFLSFILLNTHKLYALHKEIAAVDSQIATIYRQFFPNAQQVISPKFRINQLLKMQANSSDLIFWQLLDKLANAFNPHFHSIEQLQFQNQTMFINLATKDFAKLEELQMQLQQEKLKVKQTQAYTRDKQVLSTLELSL